MASLRASRHEGSSTLVPDQSQDSEGGSGENHNPQIRQSGTNWAEYDINAAPQVTVGDAPQPVIHPGTADFEADLRPPSSSENKPIPNVHRPWYKNKRFWLPLVVFVVLVAIVVPAAVVTTSGKGGPGASTTALSSASATASSTATDSSSRASESSSPSASTSPVSYLLPHTMFGGAVLTIRHRSRNASPLTSEAVLIGWDQAHLAGGSN